MKNLILNGTENNGNRHRYSFEKTKKFKNAFLKIMEKLEFETEKISRRFTSTSYDENEDEITINLRVSDINDVCWYFQNKKYEIDLFFGSKKIILIIRTKKSERENLVNIIEKNTDWISEDEKEKRQKKINQEKLRIART